MEIPGKVDLNHQPKHRSDPDKLASAKATISYDDKTKRWTATIFRKGQAIEFCCSDISLLRDFLDAKGIPDE